MLAIIPSYRAPEKLKRCLAAVESQTVPTAAFVHDNTENNLGFTKAVNLGLRRAHELRETYALVLNQDVYLLADAVEKLAAFMNAHPRCAIAGVKQLQESDPDKILHAGCGAAFPVGLHHQGKKSQGHFTISKQMPWVNGAAMVARMEAVLEFGVMDDNMFLLGSDSDWCYTARLRNWEVWYCAEVEVLHEWGVTQTKPSPQTEEIYKRDVTYWRDKWVGSRAFERLNAFRG